MCSVVVLFRPGHAWPLLLATNRDEMAGRPWRPPGRHWPDRPDVVAGLDEAAGGTWLGMNDMGVTAGILNRAGTLGQKAGFRSRGELPLEALDHETATAATEALVHLYPGAYRPFNMMIADPRGGFWLKNDGAAISAFPLPEGLSMLTAHDLNDTGGSVRQRRHLPRFRTAPTPDPDGDWFVWQALLAAKDHEPDSDSRGAMCIETDWGFGTVSSSLIALPDPAAVPVRRPVWKFCPGKPGEAAYGPVPVS